MSTNTPSPSSAAFGPGGVLQLIRNSPSWTKAELVTKSGIGRTSLTQRLELLISAGLVRQSELLHTGGRPALTYSFNPDGGRIFVADIGMRHARLGVADLDANLIATAETDVNSDDGIQAVIQTLVPEISQLLSQVGIELEQISAAGIGVPAPVHKGTILNRQNSPNESWNIQSRIKSHFPNIPVYVERDASLLARGELHRGGQSNSNMIVIKAGVETSSATVIDGNILHGSKGRAGDIAHIFLGDTGNGADEHTGYLGAIASGRTISTTLNANGRTTGGSRDISLLVRQGDRLAIALLRQVGEKIGRALNYAIPLSNPTKVIVGGNLAETPEHLIAGINSTLDTQGIFGPSNRVQVMPSSLGVQSGLIGAGQLALDALLDPDNIDAIASAIKR